MRVAVAGGSGFLGRHVVGALGDRGHELLVLARGTRATPPGATVFHCDLGRDPLPTNALRDCDAVVNLVGIKRESGSQTFQGVHVLGVSRLVAAARQAGVRRIVHVSVVCSREDASSPYHDTKWRGEELLAGSGLDVTILRPAVIYGRGDDMVTHLVKMIRFAPIFPVVGKGEAILQPVDVRDVAESVAACLERPETIGKRYDIVGPDRITLRQVVRSVAEAVGLLLAIVATPRPVMRVAVRLMERFMREPLSTPAQLRMLEEGLYGDAEPARVALGLAPRPFGAAAVRELEAAIPPLFGVSLRLVDRRQHLAWLAKHNGEVGRGLALAALAIGLGGLLSMLIPGVWLRMAAGALVLIPVALFGVRLDWRDLFRVSAPRILQGLVAAAALYMAAAAVVWALLHEPSLAEQLTTLYSWRDTVPPKLAALLLPLIIAGEEIVWRSAVTLPLAARLGPWPGILVAAAGFALAHLAMGVPLLVVVAFAAGAFWSALVVRSGSAVPALVSHLAWDTLVLYLFPFVGS